MAIVERPLSMKPSDSASMESPVPSLFQIAAFFEDFFPTRGARQIAREKISHLPFAEYMLNPERLVTVLRAKTDRPEASLPVKNLLPTKKSVRTKRSRGLEKNHRAAETAEAENLIAALPRKVGFSYYAPDAGTVKLAGDFTDWETEPVEMMHSADGTWFTVVPLAAGVYSYRFIVDGEWRDDPLSGCHMPNPFGTQNAILYVA